MGKKDKAPADVGAVQARAPGSARARLRLARPFFHSFVC
jgi:hypothetical protein